jgi:hypothetical protein
MEPPTFNLTRHGHLATVSSELLSLIAQGAENVAGGV